LPPVFSFHNTQTGDEEKHDLESFRAFLKFYIDLKGLPIGKYLSQIRERPVFIVAATGVGKTVGVPVHLFIQLCNSLSSKGQGLSPLPHVYVIEPTIPICTREMEHMNKSYHQFMEERGENNPHAHNPFGAITGPTGRLNGEAPVLFITTGVFERIARDPNLKIERVRFVIDEAHRTLRESDGVEIAVAIAKKKGAIVDFMSATVDTTTLEKDLGVQIIRATEQRFPILLKSTKAPMERCIGDLAVRCLLQPQRSVIPEPESFSREEDRRRAQRVRLHLLTKTRFTDPDNGLSYNGINERPQGMLVIVNSHQGEYSDTRRIAERVREAFSKERAQVEILRLASAVIRDPEQEESFRRRVEGIERQNGRYVIVATNVVEMGVTFPSLDYVVTMDTELETVEQYGGDIIREMPLSINGLFQRIGRVGRSRPGMAFITREDIDSGEHATYSLWDEDQLATGLRLKLIEYAIQRGKVRELAFFLLESSVSRGTEAAKTFLSALPLPSAPHQKPTILHLLEAERRLIETVGLSYDGASLNALGRKYREIAVVEDLHFGKFLAHCCLDKTAGALRYLAVVAAASESRTFRDILGRRTYLEDTAALRLRVPFAKDEFKKPLRVVWEVLKSIKKPYAISTSEIGASEEAAHHILELLKDDFFPEEPTAPSETGAGDDPIVLFLSKPVIQLDQRSELISAYNIIAYFFNKYRSELRNPLYDDFEVARVRRALRSECLDIDVNPFAVGSVIGRIAEIARHARIPLYMETKDNDGKIPEGSINAVLKLQLSIDCAAGRIRQEALPSLLNHVETRAELPKVLYEHAKMRRREILDRLKSFQPIRRSESLPYLSEDDKRRLLGLVQALSLFEIADLRKETDYRGTEKFVGVSQVAERSVVVEVKCQHTCIRSARSSFRVRGKIIPLPYRDEDGKEHVRYTLGYTTLDAEERR